MTGRLLYAGLTRPEALYVIVPSTQVPPRNDPFAPPEEEEKPKAERPYVLLRGAVPYPYPFPFPFPKGYP